jgi:hypothetical protein
MRISKGKVGLALGLVIQDGCRLVGRRSQGLNRSCIKLEKVLSTGNIIASDCFATRIDVCIAGRRALADSNRKSPPSDHICPRS